MHATATSMAIVDQVCSKLNDAGVSWALLRGRETLGSGRDVDLLVHADHLDSVEDVVFELGGRRSPVVHPWHRFFEVPDRESRTSLVLDVVTRLIYNRELRLESHLEDGCLDRRVRDGELYVLEPTDLFWTVLLHSILDKQEVTQRRRAELDSVVGALERPSPGEKFFESLCPEGWSAERALTCVRGKDFAALSGFGREIVASRRQLPTARPRGRSALVRRAAPKVHAAAWRMAGLGAVPHVLDLVEAAAVEGTVLNLRRRPARCKVVLLVPAEQRSLLENRLRAARYLPLAGRWNRLSAAGLESVELVTVSWLGLSADVYADLRDRSMPIAGRHHCRRAVGPITGNGPRPRQVRVSFSGIDGSGKSLQIRSLVAALEEEGCSTEVAWARLGFWPEWARRRVPPGLGPWLRRRTASGDKRPSTPPADDGAHRVQPPSELAHTARPAQGASPLRKAAFAVLGTVWAVGGGWNLRRHVSASDADVLVLDRYRIDGTARLKYWNEAVPLAWLDRIVRSLAPEPDVEIYLRLEPEAAYARKPAQWSVVQLTKHAKVYDELVARSRGVITLDATRDPNEIAREVWARVRPLLEAGPRSSR